MSNNEDKSWLILPMLAFSKNSDGSKEIIFGWLNCTITFKF